MLIAYRCRVCGETYLGEEKPKDCPYCGADKIYLQQVEEYDRLKPDSISKKSEGNIRKAINLEIDNAKFYVCASKKTKDEKESAIFKRLAKIEAEHAEALAELLEIEEKDIPDYKECSEDAIENYQESHNREERAIGHYKKFATEAEEKDLEVFFNAIAKIESDHLELSESKLS
ncbi:rubrerythrin [archaeon SCG-AAA382B04]|nr:rubrerythrin [archaeon SCG-AAA382B04]